jgi:4-amino-4-deoxy-L-arabinose transferase-like glycosyltransferase
MLMLIIAFWWAVENWGRNPSWKWSILAGLAGGLAIFVKFPAAFFVIGGALGAIFAYAGLRTALKNPQTWVMAVLGALPGGLYLYYGLFIGRFLGQQFQDRFYPQMLISPNFYLRWFLRADLVIDVLWLALAVLGWLFFAKRPLRIFLLALFATYLLFGLVFDFNISSHDYYSLPLIPTAALGLAAFAADLSTRLWEKIGASRLLLACAFILFLGTIGTLTVQEYLELRSNDYRTQAVFWAEVGNAIGHQPRVVSIIADYGYPLAYYGWQNNNPWPLAADIRDFKRTFALQASDKYYFLITDFDEFNLQPGLKAFLNTSYPVLAQGQGYLVFDLLHPLKPAKTP